MLRKISNMSELEEIFNEALKEHAQTVAVELTIPKQKDTEFVINRYRSIKTKLGYYKRTFGENLVHNKVSDIMALNIKPAIFGSISIFSCTYIPYNIVEVHPTGIAV